MEWAEVPAHRILKVTRHEMFDEFELYDPDGKPCIGEGEKIYRLIRKRDGKVFRLASLWPIAALGKDLFYLEEI